MQAYDLVNGKVQSCGCYNIEKLKERKGPKHPLWKGGITPLHTQIRNSIKMQDWRNFVFKEMIINAKDVKKQNACFMRTIKFLFQFCLIFISQRIWMRR